MTEFQTLRYEPLDGGTIARISMSRPEVRNAQDRRMTYELDDAFAAAAADAAVKVVILAGDGPHFSSGHDLKDPKTYTPPPVNLVGGLGQAGTEGYMANEEEIYIGMCRRWRELTEPTIASVQGKTIAGGLMLMWVCDLHHRQRRRHLLRPDRRLRRERRGVVLPPLGARAPQSQGAAVHRRRADRRRGRLARDGEPGRTPGTSSRPPPWPSPGASPEKPSFALKLAKLSVNQAVDAQGFPAAQQAAFALHHLARATEQWTVGSERPDPRGGRGPA